MHCVIWGRVSLAAMLAVILSITTVLPATAQEQSSLALRQHALDLVNKERANRNLPPLALEDKLVEAAQSHANDMLSRNYYSHYSPEGKSVSDRFQAAGGNRWLITAENIGQCKGCEPPLDYDYVRQMQKGWMDSPKHRANILRDGLTGFGFGMVVRSDGTLYGVQTFAGPGTPHGESTGANAEPLSAEGQLQVVAEEINRKRQDAGKTALKPSKALAEAARTMLPARGSNDFTIQRNDNIYSALPNGSRKDWASLTVVVASCGGCGVETVRADAIYFSGRWLDDERYNEMLMDSDVTHIGFAMAADGQGKKIGVGLMGKGQ